MNLQEGEVDGGNYEGDVGVSVNADPYTMDENGI